MPLPARPFLLLRHGQSVANTQDILSGGGYDTPLSDLGIKQASALRDTFNLVAPRPTLIIHSDMKRSRRTAEIVNEKTGLPIYGNNGLREHMFGDWEGLEWEKTKDAILSGEQPPNGECSYEFAQRVQQNMLDAFDKHPDDLIMFVAHGGTFYSFLRMYGLNTHVHIDNCHLHYFEPHPEKDPMPWRVTAFDTDGKTLESRSADFCPAAQPKEFFTKGPKRLNSKGLWVK
jgi:broad specificity phosphatase PhoE